MQLPSPIIFMCDFNAHNILCGCTANDKKWQEVCDFVLSSNLCLLNHKVPTYIHPATGSRSSLDLAFCDPSLFMEFSWKVHDDLCGSDHFPIILYQVKVSPIQETQRRKLDKADWNVFEVRCSSELVLEDIMLT